MNMKEAEALGIDLDTVQPESDEQIQRSAVIAQRKAAGCLVEDRRVVDQIDQIVQRLSDEQEADMADAMLRKQVELDQLMDMSQQMVDEGIALLRRHVEVEEEIAELQIAIEMMGNQII
jgi:hypothetical protein|tara:strand:- start:373 stop:729 length:357 start_codon:yes stop_codon:yes gene_type:complete